VTVKKQGRVRFLARLQTRDFILGEVDSSVLTSRFNTFAIMVVGGILLLIGILWTRQAAARRKAGKHRPEPSGRSKKGREKKSKTGLKEASFARGASVMTLGTGASRNHRLRAHRRACVCLGLTGKAMADSFNLANITPTSCTT